MPLVSFASDNHAGVHPEVLDAIARANVGTAPAYGADAVTARAGAMLRAELGDAVEPFFVFSGTGANVVGLATVLRPWQAVVCAETAHVNVDECGALERFTGCKLLPVPAPDGKLTVESIAPRLTGLGVEHHVQPGAISISQTTEYGTVYTPAEVRALADYAHAHGLLLHVDGARLANAAAALDGTLRSSTTDAGVDLLSFGGTKNGALGAEAVVFCRPEAAVSFRYVRKQGMQLASKMRYVAAQFEALLTDRLWSRNASHANAMARRLADGVADVPGVRITQAVQANAVFAVLPRSWTARLQERYAFYVWNEVTSEVRWMTSFATTPEEVDGFVGAVRALAAAELAGA